MSLARKLARRYVVPESVKREWYDKGVHAGAASMLKHTEKQLSDAYGQGFTEGKIKSQLATAVAAVVVLHDKFGFGKVRAKKFADYLENMTDSVARGDVKTTELMQMLVDEGLDFCSEATVEDTDGQTWKVDLKQVVNNGQV